MFLDPLYNLQYILLACSNNYENKMININRRQHNRANLCSYITEPAMQLEIVFYHAVCCAVFN